MPPTVTFTKEIVINAAYELVRKKGIKVVTARNISKKLKSSTTPIYSSYNSIDELKKDVMEKAVKVLKEYTITEYTERVFLNMGVGLTLFGRDQSQLFRALFLEGDEYRDIVDEFTAFLQKRMLNDLRFTGLTNEARNQLLYDMWIFTYGFATMICNGIIKEASNKFIIDTLLRVGTAVIKDTLEKSKENK